MGTHLRATVRHLPLGLDRYRVSANTTGIGKVLVSVILVPIPAPIPQTGQGCVKLTLHIKQKSEATPVCTNTIRHDNPHVGLHCTGMPHCYSLFFVISFKVDGIMVCTCNIWRYLLMGLKAAAILFLYRWNALARHHQQSKAPDEVGHYLSQDILPLPHGTLSVSVVERRPCVFAISTHC